MNYLILLFLLPAGSRLYAARTNDEFSAVGKAIVALLQSHDADRFARELTPDLEDYRAALSTNLPATGGDPLKGFDNRVRYQRNAVKSSAEALLARADQLHLDFSKGDLQFRVVKPGLRGTSHHGDFQAEGENLSWVQKLEIILTPASASTNTDGGDFKVVVQGLEKYPAGWRTFNGIQWESFPAHVADDNTARELALLNKVAANQGFSGKDDPALLTFGGILVRFLRDRDLAAYKKEALMNSDLIWAQMQKSGRSGPSRHDIDQYVNERVPDQIHFATEVIRQMDDAGIDLKHADIQIKEAAIERSQSQGNPGSLDGLMGEQFKLTLEVKSTGKSKNGTALSGDYVLAVNQLARYGDDWRVVDHLRWNNVPPGMVDEKTVAAMKLEDYVAEYRSLPPQTPAPEIEFITLAGEKKMKLSELRGKVVVLDFWATWCGPCQEPMAHLQRLPHKYPDWQDRVAIVPLSIDDTIRDVRSHVVERGWTNTFNVWAGEGAWQSASVKAFRVTGVPTTYIIDTDGKIVKAGHPAAMDIAAIVQTLLKPVPP
jgi:thiol-disulfide isomerase/thioredoxin